MPHMLLMAAVGYGLGSIPFGLLLTKFFGGVDIRTIGSGNIGATNVLRTGNKKLAAATLLLDALKGTVAALIGWHYGGPQFALIAGLGAFIGHILPVWLRFKGGKGVATFLGILIGIAWKAALVFAAVWLIVAYLTRYSSLAALIASIAVPVALWFMGEGQAAQMFALLTVLIFIKHHENIQRLMAGTESRIGKKSAAPESV
ncbi:MAG: glycerol-3-phosphate 1-O-acyltransferase PlsY [Beijerinckiaceae bacterium]